MISAAVTFYSGMADTLSLNREVVRGVLCRAILPPAASLLGELIRLTQQLNIREPIAGDVNEFNGPLGLVPYGTSAKSILCWRGTLLLIALLLPRVRCHLRPAR